MPHDKDLKRLVRSRMDETGERYTTARLAITGPPPAPPGSSRRRHLDELVQLLADKRARNDAMVELVGGITASDLRRIDRLPDDTVEALLRGLRDPSPPVRWWCIQLLDHVPDPRGLLAVAELLDDPVDRVRRNAVHALGCVTCKPSTDATLPDGMLERIATLAATDPNRKVRAEAAHAIACRTGQHFPRAPSTRVAASRPTNRFRVL